MKKEILKRGLMGAVFGVFISYVITILISITVGDGIFYPVVPQLAEEMGTELNAVLLQFGLSMLYGAAFGGASVIWETQWSLSRQTITHLVICSGATLPIAYYSYWMPHTPVGISLYFAMFFVVYFLIWLSTYLSIKKKLKKINHKINRND